MLGGKCVEGRPFFQEKCLGQCFSRVISKIKHLERVKKNLFDCQNEKIGNLLDTIGMLSKRTQFSIFGKIGGFSHSQSLFSIKQEEKAFVQEYVWGTENMKMRIETNFERSEASETATSALVTPETISSSVSQKSCNISGFSAAVLEGSKISEAKIPPSRFLQNRNPTKREIRERQKILAVGKNSSVKQKAQNSTKDLKANLKYYAGKRPYKCASCDYSCVQKYYLNAHQKIHTRDNLHKCQYCEYASVRIHQLKEHQRIHTGEKPFKCSKCDYSAVRKQSLKDHLTTHADEKPHKCQICSTKFARLSQLKRHHAIHTGEKPYKCASCSYSCTRAEHLRLHETVHARNDDGQRNTAVSFRCTSCSYTCSRPQHLRLHQITHYKKYGENRHIPYQCPSCDHISISQSALKTHQTIHTGEKPHKCARCDYATVHKPHLKIHQRIHTGEKPYTCSSCDYASARKGDLNAHLRIHISE